MKAHWKLLALILAVAALALARGQSPAPSFDSSNKVCISTMFVLTDSGVVQPFTPCRILAPLPVAFSKEDYDSFQHMQLAEDSGKTFMLDESGGVTDNATKALVAAFAKSFKQQRDMFCAKHPDWSVFDISQGPNGPEYSETAPRPCKSDAHTD
jgi:hypothetical protein